MDDIFRMDDLERLQHRVQGGIQHLRRDAITIGRHPLVDRLAFNELGRHVAGPLGIEHLVDRYDVGVLEGGQNLRLLYKAVDRPLESGLERLRQRHNRSIAITCRKVCRQAFFKRGFALQLLMLCEISNAKTALP